MSFHSKKSLLRKAFSTRHSRVKGVNEIESDGSVGNHSVSLPSGSNTDMASGSSSGSQAHGAASSKAGQMLTVQHMEADNNSVRQNKENQRRETSSNLSSVECSKHPGHKEFIRIHELQAHHLLPAYQHKDWVNFLLLKSYETVHISVSYTSTKRPDDLGFEIFRGTTKERTGSGTAFIMNMDKTEDCNCGEIEGVHKVSGRFMVMTVAHIVFDDAEAQSTVVTFFNDDDGDRTTTVMARGERVSHIDIERNRSVIECRTHDLTLYHRLSDARNKRMSLIENSLSAQVNHEPMVVLISHPHGMSKRISVGRLLNIIEEGEIKTTSDGVEMIACILTYDTPTCPGAGGGSINVIGKGEVCSAFAPHCASHGNGENTSGLGWTKYVKSLQLRVSSK